MTHLVLEFFITSFFVLYWTYIFPVSHPRWILLWHRLLVRFAEAEGDMINAQLSYVPDNLLGKMAMNPILPYCSCIPVQKLFSLGFFPKKLYRTYKQQHNMNHITSHAAIVAVLEILEVVMHAVITTLESKGCSEPDPVVTAVLSFCVVISWSQLLYHIFFVRTLCCLSYLCIA